MGLRVCLVTPFAWSRPHDVNEHVAGVAHELRGLGHEVTVLAPSTRTADLLAGRRALLDGGPHDLIALGPALGQSRLATGGKRLVNRRHPEEEQLVDGIEEISAAGWVALKRVNPATEGTVLT